MAKYTVIEEEGAKQIVVTVPNPLAIGDEPKATTYKFKPFTVGEMQEKMYIPKRPAGIEQMSEEEKNREAAIMLQDSQIYILNAMMILGDTITKETPNYVVSFLRNALKDFL